MRRLRNWIVWGWEIWSPLWASSNILWLRSCLFFSARSWIYRRYVIHSLSIRETVRSVCFMCRVFAFYFDLWVSLRQRWHPWVVALRIIPHMIAKTQLLDDAGLTDIGDCLQRLSKRTKIVFRASSSNTLPLILRRETWVDGRMAPTDNLAALLGWACCRTQHSHLSCGKWVLWASVTHVFLIKLFITDWNIYSKLLLLFYEKIDFKFI